MAGKPLIDLPGITDDNREKIEAIKKIQAMKDQEIATRMAMVDRTSEYQRPPAPDGQGKIMQMCNALEPFHYDEDGRIISGDVPGDALVDFFGFLAPPNSLTNLDERQHDVGMQDFRISRISRRWARPRKDCTPERNAMEDNAEHLFRVKSAQALGGFERVMGATQRFETEQDYRVQRNPSRLNQLYDKVRGKE